MRFLARRRRLPRPSRSFLEPLAHQWFPLPHGPIPDMAMLPQAADARQCTALMYAVAGAPYEAIRRLVPRSELNNCDVTGKTALHYALLAGNLRAAVLLLRHGADVNIADRRGCTPLMLAALLGYHAIVQELLLKGARRDAVDTEGRDCRAYAQAGRSSDIIALLQTTTPP